VSKVLPLAKKLVGLAKEQRNALELGAGEQFDWIALRRDEVTERLSRLLAANTPVSPTEAATLGQLRAELLAVDGAMEAQLRAKIAEVSGRKRVFRRGRKAVGAYLAQGSDRSGLFDQRQ